MCVSSDIFFLAKINQLTNSLPHVDKKMTMKRTNQDSFSVQSYCVTLSWLSFPFTANGFWLQKGISPSLINSLRRGRSRLPTFAFCSFRFLEGEKWMLVNPRSFPATFGWISTSPNWIRGLFLNTGKSGPIHLWYFSLFSYGATEG